MPTAKALQLCPNLILLPPDRPLYRQLHDAMRAVTDQLFPLTEWSSIDEFYADTTDLQTRHPDPRSLGQLVKDTLFEATGLRCTIAVATGKTVAKIAADSHKPDGLVMVPPGTEQVFLAPRPLRALPGIGPKTAARLEPLGLRRSASCWTELGSALASYLRRATALGSGTGAGDRPRTGGGRSRIQEPQPRDHVRTRYP